jgi:hypothetical protein
MLGVLGGMGPQATADFLSTLVKHTDADTDQEHLPVVAWFVPSPPRPAKDAFEVTEALARSCTRFFGGWSGRPAARSPTLAVRMAC